MTKLNIDPQYIEQLASEAYWNFVYKHSIRQTGFPTHIQDIPSTLWSRDILISALDEMKAYENHTYTKELIEALYYGVAETIVEHNIQGKNIVGLIYAEDFRACKDPNFIFNKNIEELRSDADKKCGYLLELKGKDFLNEGDLLLRTPLPSGILLKFEPKNAALYIPNTIKALGFQKTIILPITNISPLPLNEQGYKYFATGVFHIPTQQNSSSEWLKLIPNATGALDSIALYSPNGVNEVFIRNEV